MALLTFTSLVLPRAVIAVALAELIAVTGRPSWRRLATAALVSDLGVALVAGWAADALLPADYTARHDWTRCTSPKDGTCRWAHPAVQSSSVTGGAVALS